MANNKNNNKDYVAHLKGEAVRYFKNGQLTIKKTPRRNGWYLDPKPLQEGADIIYLGVLDTLKAFALTRGYNKDNLPQGYNEYIDLLSKHAIHNGKLKKAFRIAYTHLHVLVHYRKETDAEIVKEGVENARFVIEKLTGKRIS